MQDAALAIGVITYLLLLVFADPFLIALLLTAAGVIWTVWVTIDAVFRH
jgi:hypothetical protein